jgi:hypothetical protein
MSWKTRSAVADLRPEAEIIGTCRLDISAYSASDTLSHPVAPNSIKNPTIAVLEE